MNIKKFIQDKISLDKEHRDKISQEYKLFKEEFEGKLRNGERYYTRVTKQGSVATKTAIKPLDKDDKFDLDIAILVPSTGHQEEFDIAENLKAFADRQYRGEVHKVAFQTSRGILDIDLVPMFGEVGGSQRVYDTSRDSASGCIQSDNLNLRDDFNEGARESATSNDNALRETVMLVKYVLRENEVKGVPSVVINCLALSAQKSTDYKQAMINYLSTIAEEFRINKGYIHNPSNGVHITYKDGHKAYEVITQLTNSIIDGNTTRLSRVAKAAGAFFAGAGAIAGAAAVNVGKVAGGATSYSNEKENL